MAKTHLPHKRSVCFAFTAAVTVLGAAPSALADGNGWFSPDQLGPGRSEYSQKCSVCHGAQLQGGGAPALKGQIFVQQWSGKSLKDLYSYVRDQMPLGQARSLDPQEYADVVAYMLAQSGLPSGNQKLTADSPMQQVLELSAATTGAPPAASAPPVKIGELHGPLKQPTTDRPTQAELDQADADTGSWLMYNKGYRGERYSLLQQINVGNANKLRPVCMFQLGEVGTFSTGPVVYDGVLYATTHLGTYAIDATSCRKLW